MKGRRNNAETGKKLSATPLASAVSPTTKTGNVTNGDKPPIHTCLDRETSPTSVVSHPLSNGRQPLATPKVYTLMGEEGAEVSLSTPPAGKRPPLSDRTNIVPPAVTPENGRRIVHMHSLLDADISPDVENKEESRPSLGSHMFCGTGGPDCFSADDSNACMLVQAPQASVERTITLLLGDPYGLDGWCHGWHAWFFFGVEYGEDHTQNNRESKEDMKRVLRNRAYDLSSRNRRIHALKNDLCPFDVTPPRVSASIPLTKTRSFSEHEHASRKKDNLRSTSSLSDISLNMSVVSLGSAVWESMPGCGHRDSDSPAIIRSRDFGAATEDLCYDSDPEDITRRRTHHDESDKHAKDATFVSFNDTKPWPGGNKQNEAGSRTADLAIPRRLEAIFNDDDCTRDVVQEFMNEKMTLVWHRSAKPDARSKGTPQAMIMWIERGQQLNAGLIQPKLVWRPVRKYEGGMQRRGLSTPTSSLESLELLDISRILEVNRIDRKLYPFAKRKSCFLVESLDRKMMFEACTEAERDRIVNGLKLVVARFASKVIVKDHEVFDEFFTSYLSKVPGEAPRWAQEDKNLSLL